MKRLIISVVTLLGIQGCMYGFVFDAETGARVAGVTVDMIRGQCLDADCNGTDDTPLLTDADGFYVYDPYDFDYAGAGLSWHGQNDKQYIYPLDGETTVQMRYSKPGYQALTLFHNRQYSSLKDMEYEGRTYKYTRVVDVYLCPIGSVDSDNDRLCDLAEYQYGTDPFNNDTDGDGFTDGAEILGLNGIDLQHFGANPLRKDKFVELDYYPGRKPDPAGLQMVVDAFNNAPVSNPNGEDGINLVFFVDDELDPADAYNEIHPDWEYVLLKNKYFTPDHQGIFHYGLIAYKMKNKESGGFSKGSPSDSFAITQQGGHFHPDPNIQAREQAGIIMHELGHNLGLRHGGATAKNFKPNYFSIMNYTYGRNLTVDGTKGVLDYSRVAVASIDEEALDEVQGFAPEGDTTEEELERYDVYASYHNLIDGVNYPTFKLLRDLNRGASLYIDFNNDGHFTTSVAANIDGNDRFNVIESSWNDWENIQLDAGNRIGDAGNSASTSGLAKDIFSSEGRDLVVIESETIDCEHH